MASAQLEVFQGEIFGFGSEAGHRFVVGRWPSSPFGSFADVMHEAPDGSRTLLAPTEQVADFVQGTYNFDHVQIVPVKATRTADSLDLSAGGLLANLSTGGRTVLGFALRAVPTGVATSRWWCGAIDPLARMVLRGVRTKGTAGNGRREWYGATDQHRIVALTANLDGTDLGSLADVWPPVRFGFSSTPRRPGVVSVTTTIELPNGPV